MKLTKYHLEQAREWLKDIDFVDADEDDIDAASDVEIERVVKKCWDGGIDDFIQMCDAYAEQVSNHDEDDKDDDDCYELTERDELIAQYGLSNYEFVKDQEWICDDLEHYLGKHQLSNLNSGANQMIDESGLTWKITKYAGLQISEKDSIVSLGYFQDESLVSNYSDFLTNLNNEQQTNDYLNHLVAGNKDGNFIGNMPDDFDIFDGGFDSDFNVYFEV